MLAITEHWSRTTAVPEFGNTGGSRTSFSRTCKATYNIVHVRKTGLSRIIVQPFIVLYYWPAWGFGNARARPILCCWAPGDKILVWLEWSLINKENTSLNSAAIFALLTRGDAPRDNPGASVCVRSGVFITWDVWMLSPLTLAFLHRFVAVKSWLLYIPGNLNVCMHLNVCVPFILLVML